MTGPKGRVIWITGFSGSGKTTLAQALLAELPQGTLHLDGDALREVLGQCEQAYDYESRKRLAFVYARLARMLADQGATVVVSTISLFHALHAWNRSNISHYLEIFLDIPEDERVRRDPKGLYAARGKGAAAPMACAVAPELPLAPHVRITLQDHPTLEAAVRSILAALG